ncbi:MAG: hypothetical protein ISR55_05170 [Bacteroidetes bacterium]|nr:hypothetical protein [Bacteroidota bacterium]MBL6963193.1 hypothetical protein [Bacteroidota bacterium]
MKYKIGIDLGSSYTKGALVDENNKLIEVRCVKTGYDFNRAANKIIDEFKVNYEIQDPVFTCGYGRDQLKIPFISNSEIIALSKAVFDLYKRKCSVVDIGGQDTKYIKINDQGQVDKFKMNRKCAAGTGSFIEEIAYRLDISTEEFNDFAKQATEEVKINSFCTVFAISEIIGMIKNGTSLPNIIIGIYNSIVSRCVEMSPIEDFLVLSGGVPPRHPMIVEQFKKIFHNLENPENSQFLAAYGCVLLNN